MADVRFVEVSGATKAIVDGRLDAASVDALETRFLSGVMASGSNAIVDLSGVSFIASLGIRMLLSAARALRNRDRKLAIFGASAVVMEIIQSTALSDVIPVLNSEAEALATLSP
ncbi:MAG: STAS domain-containing protein [Novosphingobium sp.]